MAQVTSQEALRPKRPWLTLQRRMTIGGYIFLLPNIIGFLVFTALPVLGAVVLSFYKWDVLTPAKFVGLANYERLFTRDPLFRKALLNTLYYVILTVPPVLIIGLGLAMLVNQKLKGVGIFRAIYFMPVVGLLVAEGLLWQWLYDADFGLINGLLRSVSLQPVPWLGSTKWAMPAVAFMSVWRVAGYYMVIFLAGLQSIPPELYEAAAIDGANRWHQFRHITLPLLTPVIFLALVIAVINSFQVFTSAWVLTQGGPYYATTTIILHLYNKAFGQFKMGYASAIAMVLFVIIFVVTVIQSRMQREWVHYE